MNYKFFIGLLLIPTISLGVIAFSGLSEDSSIDKNSFSCSSSLDAQGEDICQDRAASAVNFEFDGPRTLQIFNNQQFWVQKKYKEQQLLMARMSQEDEVDSTLKSRGWSITGGFLVVITTDSFITNQIEPKKVPAKGQVKVVAQLWYNGDNLIQLWAQDVALVKDGSSFSVSLTSTDSDISKESTVANPPVVSKKSGTAIFAVAESVKLTQNGQGPKNFSELQKQFLQEIELAPKNAIKSVYSVAVGSPKNIKITI